MMLTSLAHTEVSANDLSEEQLCCLASATGRTNLTEALTNRLDTSSRQNVATPDLIVVPQLGRIVPGDHLSSRQRESVLRAWESWGNRPIYQMSDTWTVHIVHFIGGNLQPIRVREIPKLFNA